MGNNQHLKRHSAPVSWTIKRKENTFVAKPNPGSHNLKYVVPIVVVIRDILKYAETSKEVKLILNSQDILINGKKVNDVKTPVGLFDIFEIKQINAKYVILFDEFGKIRLVDKKDDGIFLKISKKTITPGKKYQLNFMNGFNLLVDEKTFKNAKVNDTVVYDISKKKIISVIPLKEGVFTYIFDGKFQGKFGLVNGFISYSGVAKDVVEIVVNGAIHSTAKDYCFAVADKKEGLLAFK